MRSSRVSLYISRRGERAVNSASTSCNGGVSNAETHPFSLGRNRGQECPTLTIAAGDVRCPVLAMGRRACRRRDLGQARWAPRTPRGVKRCDRVVLRFDNAARTRLQRFRPRVQTRGDPHPHARSSPLTPRSSNSRRRVTHSRRFDRIVSRLRHSAAPRTYRTCRAPRTYRTHLPNLPHLPNQPAVPLPGIHLK